jgi:hypothetical protein
MGTEYQKQCKEIKANTSTFSPARWQLLRLSHETFLIKVRLDMQLILRNIPVSAPGSALPSVYFSLTF